MNTKLATYLSNFLPANDDFPYVFVYTLFKMADDTEQNLKASPLQGLRLQAVHNL